MSKKKLKAIAKEVAKLKNEIIEYKYELKKHNLVYAPRPLS